MSMLIKKALEQSIDYFIREDDLDRNFYYISKLPQDKVQCHLKLKSDVVLAGLPFFFEVFSYLLGDKIEYQHLLEKYEGYSFKKEDKVVIDFELPFHVALTGERLALNLLHRASSIATTTNLVVKKLDELGSDLKILDTRKTTPGLRFLEKYAVVTGGGNNHRFAQADTWMIKDNHKKIFGSLKAAWDFFKSMKAFYQPVVVEIHDLNELEQAMSYGVRHVMLDNFTTDQIHDAIKIKKSDMTYEVSGGITLENIHEYNIPGLDVASMGSLTSYPKKVDLSLKFEKLS